MRSNDVRIRGRWMVSNGRSFIRKSILLAGILTAGLMPLGAEAVSVLPSHPRILIYADSLPALRARIQSNPTLGQLYDTWYDYYDVRRNHSNYNDHWTDDMAALYAITGETKFSDVAIREAMKTVRGGGENQLGFSRLSVVVLTYDWCYPVIPVAQRDSMRAYCLTKVKTMTLSNGPYDWKDRRWHYALAIHGEVGSDNDLVDAKLQESIDLERDFCLPCMDQVNGGGSCGLYPGVMYSLQMVFIDCLRHAMGQSTLGANSSWWNNSPAGWMHRLRPDWEWGRTGGRYNLAEAYHLVFFSYFGSRMSNPYAQYLSNVLASEPQDGYALLGTVLWYVPTSPASLPTGLGQTYVDDQYGYYFWRSGWNLGPNSNDIQVMFFNGPDVEADRERTQNMFTVTRGNDDLLISGGHFYDSSDQHYTHYAARTVSRNTVLIYDPDEDFGGTFPNDGGQMASDFTLWHTLWPECTAQVGYRGEADPIPTDPGLAFGVRGYATAAYSSDKSRAVCRELRIPQDRNWILLQDHVELNKPNLEVRLLFHSIEKPEISGVPELVQGSSYGGIYRWRQPGVITITRGDSRCRIYPCYASGGEMELRLVGGSSPSNLVWRQSAKPATTLTYVANPADQAYECWVDGLNRSPTHSSVSQGQIDARNVEPHACGDWRVEILIRGAAAGGEGLDLITAIEVGSTMIPTRVVTAEDVGDGRQLRVLGAGEEFVFHLPDLECPE